MIELRPASMKLEIGPGASFPEYLDDITHRFIDVIGGDPTQQTHPWVNDHQSVTFSMRRPTTHDLANLACIVAQIKPDRIDYLNACGDHCIVYWMQWDAEQKEEKDENST